MECNCEHCLELKRQLDRAQELQTKLLKIRGYSSLFSSKSNIEIK